MSMKVTKDRMKEIMSHPELITDARLREEVEYCKRRGGDYSPRQERISMLIGKTGFTYSA